MPRSGGAISRLPTTHRERRRQATRVTAVAASCALCVRSFAYLVYAALHWNGSGKIFVARNHLNGELRKVRLLGDPFDMWC